MITVMEKKHQIKTGTRVRLQQIAGQLALLTGIGLLGYALTAIGLLPSPLATKPDFACSPASANTTKLVEAPAREQVDLRLDGATRELWRDQKRAKTRSTPATTAAIRQRLANRKIALVDAMRANPDAAIKALLTKNERTNLEKYATNCLESPVTYQGALESTHLDDFQGSGSTFEYVLTTTNGKKLQLHIAHNQAAEIPDGATVRVHGYQIGDEVLLDAAPAPAGSDIDAGSLAVLSAPSAPALTTYKVAVIMAYFADEPLPTSPTIAGMRDLLNNTIDDYYQENSYGKVGFSGDVYGWYQIPINAADCNYGPVVSAANAAAAPDIDYSQYTHRSIYFHPVYPNCPYAGFASIGGTGTYIGVATPYVFGHELGHNLGLNHAQYYPCDPPFTDIYYVFYNTACQPVEYGDFYDIMGSFYPGHFTASHKEFIRFFDPGMIQTVPPGTHEYVLEPVETATQGLKAIKVLRGEKTVYGKDDYLYVEYRQPLGFDASYMNAGRDVYDGAVLHVLGATQSYSGLFDPTPAHRSPYTSTLPVGSSYTDPMSGTTIQTIGQTADALDVLVTTGRTDLTNPNVGIVEPGWYETVSGTINVGVNASDPSGINHVDFQIGSKATPILATRTNPPYEMSLDTTTLPNGLNYIVVTGYDGAGQSAGLPGNWLTTSRAITVANDDTISPTVSLTTPTPGGSVTSGAVNFSADASDNVGVWKVEFYIDGSSTPTLIDMAAPYAGQTNIFSIGSHTIKAAGYDLAGNRVDTPLTTFSIVDDTVWPTVTLLTPSTNDAVSGNVHVTFTKNDDSGYLNLSFLMVDGVPSLTAIPAADDYWWDSRSVSNGQHQLAVQVADKAGHYVESAIVTITVDNSVPTVTVDSPAAGPLPRTVDITATANHGRGISRVDFYRDGVRLIGSDTTTPYSISWDTQSVSPGPHTITARAVSTTGANATSGVVSVTTVDYILPTVSLNFPTTGAMVTGNITLTATAADTPAPSVPRVEFTLDGSVFLGLDTTSPYTLDWDSLSVPLGTHTLNAIAIDAAGNTIISPTTTFVVTIPDSLPPGAVMNLTAQ